MTVTPPVIFVTGAGGGIGAAICHLAVAQGWRAVAADLNREAAERTAAAHPEHILPVVLDVAEEGDVDRAFTIAEEQWGTVRAVVNNAGFAEQTPFSQLTQDMWTREFHVMVSGAIHTIRRAASGLRGASGSVINIASVNGMGFYSHPTYSAVKAALLSLTGSLAALYGPRALRINAVAPGTVITPIWGTDPDAVQARIDPLLPYVPLGKMATPQDIAAAVMFLASDAAGQITGATLPVDGGLTTGILPMAHLISGRD